MCICNPHSPSGTLYSKESLLDLVDFCHKKDIIFSIDENYIEFAEKGEETTLAGMVKEYENLFVIRSVTKFYGMAGIRFGYGIAAKDWLEAGKCSFTMEHQQSCVLRHTCSIQRQRIHRKHKSNNRQRKRSNFQKLKRNRGLTRIPFSNKLYSCKNTKPKNNINQTKRIAGKRTHPNPRLLHI